MPETYVVYIPERVVQAVTGEVEKKKICVELTNAFIKKINELSKGEVYFKKMGDFVTIEEQHYEFDYAKRVLRSLIEDYVTESFKKGKAEGVKIDVNTLNLEEFKKALKECEKKRSERVKIEKEKEAAKKKVEEILKEWKEKYGIKGEVYTYSLKLSYNINGRSFEILSIPYSGDIRELPDKLTKKEIIGILSQALAMKIAENERLKKKIKELEEKTKEEVLRELWENEETVTIDLEKPITLRVVSDEDY